MNPSGTQTLIDALTDGNHLRLVDHEISGLLGWLAGSSGSREARELRRAFGQAGDNERVTERGFRLLDQALFNHQRLFEDAAGVGTDRSDDERRRRYRLLLSAFHPDRYPDRADWLTERSQIITIAYSRFKSGKDPIRPAPVVKSRPMVVRKRPRRLIRPPTQWLSRLARLLRQNFGGDPWLAQKIIGGFALVLLLPLLSVLLDTLISRSLDTDGEGPVAVVEAEQQAEAPESPAPPPAAPARQPTQTLVSDTRPTTDEPVTQEPRAEDPTDGSEVTETAAQGRMQLATNERQTAAPAEIDLPARPGMDTASASPPEDTIADASAAPSGRTESDTTLPEPEDERARRSSNAEAAVAAARPTETPERGLARTAVAAPSPVEAGRPAASALAASTGGQNSEEAGPNSDNSANSPNSADSQESAQQPTSSARGRLLLGPLGSHQIGALLQQYQLALEQADIETLSQLVGSEQAEALRARFPGLFESGEQHRVDLSILQSQRDGDQWIVRLQQEVDVAAIDRRARNFSHRAEFRFSPDPLAIRIVAMEF